MHDSQDMNNNASRNLYTEPRESRVASELFREFEVIDEP
jgi:hypothetical protein